MLKLNCRDDLELPLVGRNDQLHKMGCMLISEETELPMVNSGTTKSERPMVISVIGKSGVGKIKLVKEIYEKHSTKRYFDVKAWVTCAPNLSAFNIMKLILLRLTEVPVACSKEEDLQGKLEAVLKGHKYLLVIDGEVSSTEWNYMLSILAKDKDNFNSRVVRITQATDLESPPVPFVEEKILLQHFNEQVKTLKLFMATLFMDEKEKHVDSLEKKEEKHLGGLEKKKEKHDDDLGKKKEKYDIDLKKKEEFIRRRAKFIFDVTGGLPLAIVLLSGLLQTKEYPGEWKKVFKHLKSNLNERKRLDIILSMCFDDLPHDLKSCFLYFAGFPANTLVKVRSLVYGGRVPDTKRGQDNGEGG